MKALVLGGTGAIGADLIDFLTQKGWKVNVTSRRTRDNSREATFIRGNAHDLNFLSSVLREKWDIIVDCMSYTTQEFKEKSRIFLKSTGQYIFLSSARVYADSDAPLTEESPRLLDVCKDSNYLATDEYALAKARQEDILQRSNLKNWIIIRPYITYSPYRLQLGALEKEEWLYRSLQGRKIVVSSEIQSRLTTLTSGQDVASAISRLVGKGSVLGEIFQITYSSPIRWSDVLNIYLEEISYRHGFVPEVIEADSATFRAIIPRPYQINYDRLYNRVFDSGKLHHFTNLESFIPPAQGIRNSIKKFLDKVSFLDISWPLEARKDFFTKQVAGMDEMHTFFYAQYLTWRYLMPVKHLITRGKYI
jgi:nucleoside-diphosphate-sugar epimerase